MDISICFADFPTEKIAETTRAYRQLGIGYANLGALLMATGHAYDSEGGRAIAAAITSLMTGAAYKTSAELAAAVGPYDGYARNAKPHKRVIRKHADASDASARSARSSARSSTWPPRPGRSASKIGRGQRLPERAGQPARADRLPDRATPWSPPIAGWSGSVRARRCLRRPVAGRSISRCPPMRARARPRSSSSTARSRPAAISTESGYEIQGTLAHRVKVVDPATGAWVWKRLADIAPGDVVPMQMRHAGRRATCRCRCPSSTRPTTPATGTFASRTWSTPELAELVGYFMGDGSLHAKGIRLCVADTDLDVVGAPEGPRQGAVRTRARGHAAGGIPGGDAAVRPARALVAGRRVRQGPAGRRPQRQGLDPEGARQRSSRPTTRRSTRAFLRGLFEADGTVLEGVPEPVDRARSLSRPRFARCCLPWAGRPRPGETVSGWGGPIFQVRLRNVDHALRLRAS